MYMCHVSPHLVRCNCKQVIFEPSIIAHDYQDMSGYFTVPMRKPLEIHNLSNQRTRYY